jgi:hypothetical protein
LITDSPWEEDYLFEIQPNSGDAIMSDISLIAEFMFVAVLAGIVATTGMTLFLYAVNASGASNADMLKAIGSLFTRSMESAFQAGVAFHAFAGLAFAMFYTIILNGLGIQGFLPCVAIGSFIGLAHGFAMSFILVVSVAEHHPLKVFREAGFGVAVIHLLGHVLYGALIGAVVGASGFRLI